MVELLQKVPAEYRQSPEATKSLCKALSIALARFPRVRLGHLPTPSGAHGPAQRAAWRPPLVGEKG